MIARRNCRWVRVTTEPLVGDRPANEPRLLGARYRFGGSNRYRSGFLLLGRDRDRDRAPCWPPRPNRDEQPIDRDETEQHLPKSRFVRFGSGFSGNLGV